jgi:hypothetical protein
MNSMKKQIKLSATLLLSVLMATAQTEQKSAVDVVDQYFEQLSAQSEFLTTLFTPEAGISTVVYDSNGIATQVKYARESYLKELQRTGEYYNFIQEPVVLIDRSYRYSTSIYTSVFMQFVSKDGTDTLKSKSVQSFKLLFIDGNWRIDHLSIQNEIPGTKLDDYLWPDELTASLSKVNPVSAPEPIVSLYDENKIYSITEVDEKPVYPGKSSELSQLLKKYNADNTGENGSPFLILISEDGGASLYYVNDLSGEQIKRAQALTEAMMPWYPALKNKASVKCKLKLTIQ